MACCVGAKHNHWCKYYEITYVDNEGNEYCIFHAPAEHKYVSCFAEWREGVPRSSKKKERPALMAEDDFNQLVFKRIKDVVDAGEEVEPELYDMSIPENWTPRCNFAGTIFLAHISFTEFKSTEKYKFLPSINFNKCIFKGYVFFNEACFGGYTSFNRTTFLGMTYFDDARVSKHIDFTGSKFYSEVFFRRTEFLAPVLFFSTVFNNEVHFQSTEFHDEIKMSSVCFNGDIKFAEVDFYNQVSFIDTLFNNDVSFNKVKFRDIVNFEKAKFIGSLNLILSHFRSASYFYNMYFCKEADFSSNIFNHLAIFHQVEFQGETFFNHVLFREWAYFQKSTFKEPTTFAGAISKETILFEASDITNLSLTETNIESFKFINCNWDNAIKEKYAPIYDERHSVPTSEVEEIYRRLKKISINCSDQVQTSAWHYREKRCQQKIRNENLLTTPSNWFKAAYLNLYFLSSGFGEKPLRAFLILCSLFTAPLALLAIGYCGPHFTFKLCDEIFPTADHIIRRWLWYLPLIKTNVAGAVISDWNYLWKAILNVLLPIQAALFAFALRNKLRR
ncbi:pentapeptide repeat-containing protein [Desulfovibrio sp. JC010]|uniref:pentapeptide repeat-containing protein n=1 Tax=Desulfovibrio sp. JC010 TaxID=2593641 RepID=UPI0013D21E32|nr:pentapeptide repeat-containing protein [Desulfovibrio sp. JC010]NDV28044.1 hypothetical protein [Desulfovibrio sp. JC010]